MANYPGRVAAIGVLVMWLFSAYAAGAADRPGTQKLRAFSSTIHELSPYWVTRNTALYAQFHIVDLHVAQLRLQSKSVTGEPLPLYGKTRNSYAPAYDFAAFCGFCVSLSDGDLANLIINLDRLTGKEKAIVLSVMYQRFRPEYCRYFAALANSKETAFAPVVEEGAGKVFSSNWGHENMEDFSGYSVGDYANVYRSQWANLISCEELSQSWMIGRTPIAPEKYRVIAWQLRLQAANRFLERNTPDRFAIASIKAEILRLPPCEQAVVLAWLFSNHPGMYCSGFASWHFVDNRHNRLLTSRDELLRLHTTDMPYQRIVTILDSSFVLPYAGVQPTDPGFRDLVCFYAANWNELYPSAPALQTLLPQLKQYQVFPSKDPFCRFTFAALEKRQ